ncbi:LysM peptidoglycan-binding domain-containing protein [Streptomyces indiaensis]|nr:LysM peptidoglycan-binding domain-containing protein [Streptomyces indiaensis]MCF1644589.1 LysM peptidoglycan-binding domain-containing protein [Streptomyces indiaensis]
MKGDTLARIALTFYGDRERWPEIAEANNLTQPDKLEEGQQLTIP